MTGGRKDFDMYSIVIADDEHTICNNILAVIHSAFPDIRDVKVFNSGTSAYDYVSTHAADILILDIMMPGKSGLDIAEQLSSLKPETYVIIITAHHNFDYSVRAINCNVGALLPKPFSSQQLIDVLKKAFSSIQKKSLTKSSTRRSYRHLLHALCQNVSISDADQVCFCQHTTPIRDLLCTEVVIHSDGWSLLPVENRVLAAQVLEDSVEHDTSSQTTCLFDATHEVRFLTFSKGQPDLYYVADAMHIVSAYTNSESHSSHASFSSLSAYRQERSFYKELDTFLKLTSDSGFLHARKHIMNFLGSLSAEELESFKEFLLNNHKIKIPSGSADEILRYLEEYANRMAGGSTNYLVEAACKHIQTHFSSSSFSLEETADTLCVSSAHLSRLFKKHLNQNFFEILLKTRMENAAHLLESTNLPTKEIAIASGYENPAYFRASFKRYFNLTPNQYRQFAISKRGMS